MTLKSVVVKSTAIAVIGAGMLVGLEVSARWIGLGDPIVFYNDAWGGLRPLPLQRVERIRGVRVTVDENGFRSAKPPMPGALRVLYIGDSVTWGGSTIDDAALFTELAGDAIRQRGRAVYAMNAAVNATALVNHAEIFLRGVPPDSVDILVWLFPWQDVDRAYATVSYLWPPTSKPRFALVEVVDHLLHRFWTRSLRKRGAPINASFGSDADQAYARFSAARRPARIARNLEAAHAVVAEASRRGVPAIVGVTPLREGNVLAPLPDEARAFLVELPTHGVRVFDATAALGGVGADVGHYYYDHVHFSAEGHRVIGKALGAILWNTIVSKSIS
jgi:hypothetical protein